MTLNSTSTKVVVLALVTAVVIATSVLVDPVPQDQQYHQFADQRAYFAIPNVLNVATNLFFALIGIIGLYLLWIRRSLVIVDSLFAVYGTFFVALAVIAPGSAYYHWMPDNQSLVWDRLPMTLAFMSFFTITLAERLSLKFARIIFLPLIIVGVLSIVYWHHSELAGNGDLRPYGLVQFLPMLLVPMILLMFDEKFTHGRAIWWFLGWYLVAKIFELLDQQVFEWLGLISGHSLKHLGASIGCFIYLRYLQTRSIIGSENQT